jgi:NAD(P)-dependent dehydrogenase (short-subunit alcohol dehydrogenase family)
MSGGADANGAGLAGQVCVVTGAGGGIGRATALALAREGGHLAIVDRAADTAEETRREVEALGRRAIVLACDTSDEASVRAAADRVAVEFGPCRVLVNNAGILRPGPLETLTAAEWNAVLAVNLTGYFLCAQAFGRPMREAGGGSMVHVASIAAHHATGFSGAYSVAKAGIAMLSRQLAIEWGAAGIRSNVVNPGLILTPMSRAFYEQPGAAERRSAVVPAGRIGRPEDVAEAVLFLAGPRSAYVTGDEITVDGGFTRNIMSLIPRSGYEASGGGPPQ